VAADGLAPGWCGQGALSSKRERARHRQETNNNENYRGALLWNTCAVHRILLSLP
jgi:hypothetical protein